MQSPDCVLTPRQAEKRRASGVRSWRGCFGGWNFITMNRASQITRELSAVSRRRIALLSVVGWLLVAAGIHPATGQIRQIPHRTSVEPPVIVVGFLGGFVRNDDDRHPEVRIIQRLDEERGPQFHAIVFENRRRTRALKEIQHWLDTDGDGRLSTEEKQNARIVLFGHSWGGSAVNKLARELDRRGIPVLLTIQIDSINKGWGHDCVVPANVAKAENFYQTGGLVHGCRSLRAADPGKTEIIGNFEFEYTAQPAGCRSFSWFNRHFFETHNAMECDPRVWSRIEMQIRAQWRDVGPIYVAPQPVAEYGAASPRDIIRHHAERDRRFEPARRFSPKDSPGSHSAAPC